jgi:hypothetical protein
MLRSDSTSTFAFVSSTIDRRRRPLEPITAIVQLCV